MHRVVDSERKPIADVKHVDADKLAAVAGGWANTWSPNKRWGWGA